MINLILIKVSCFKGLFSTIAVMKFIVGVSSSWKKRPESATIREPPTAFSHALYRLNKICLEQTRNRTTKAHQRIISLFEVCHQRKKQLKPTKRDRIIIFIWFKFYNNLETILEKPPEKSASCQCTYTQVNLWIICEI